MDNLSQLISDLKQYSLISNAITNNELPALITGVSHIHKANIISLLHTNMNKQILVITANEGVSKRLYADIKGFTNREILMLNSRDFLFHNISSSSKNMQQNRIETLYKLLDFKGIIIATIDSLLCKAMPKNILEKSVFDIKISENYDIKELLEKLQNNGYMRCMQVEGVAQFSLKGGILDIFPVAYDKPIRIEFFDDEVDTISYFDIDTQRRTQETQSVKILPSLEVLPYTYNNGAKGLADTLREYLNDDTPQELSINLKKDIEKLENEGVFPAIDRYMTLIYNDNTTILEYFSKNAIICFDDLNRVTDQARAYFTRQTEDIVSLIERGVVLSNSANYIVDFDYLYKELEQFKIVILDTFLQKNDKISPKTIINITAKQLSSYSGNLEILTNDIDFYYKNDYKIIILCSSDLRLKHMAEVLSQYPVKITNNPKGRISLVEGALSCGFEFPEIKLVVFTEGQILAKPQSKKAKKSNRQHVTSYSDLAIGDIVVHEHHGIGRFSGIEKMIVDGAERDYIKISFAGTDSLFVPASNLNLISKYIGKGGEDVKIRLNKLGGTEWQKSKIKAKSSAKDLAKYLIGLYAKRSRLKGFAFEKDDVWQEDFENAFIYDETDDQLRSIAEIKADMEKPIPMDRLLCGDVGFGKTEVALRAIMKCVLCNKQSAILVPTTVLARQHYLTAIERFNGYPIKIEFISRFKTKKEENIIKERLKEGSIDLIIGTHKLFMKEVKFKDLGLLIIDEEQRFGVAHKEKLKELGSEIDVLMLSATPIPRTLNMALSGIRDMSILEEAPHNRRPIESYVLEYDFAVIIDAIERELSRDGQCFYLHNRIDSIDSVAYKLKLEFPEANIEVAHGKMTQKQLSTIMTRMSDGEIDILVATTIIETGIDIANANTLIIEDADKMGLAQLHQIRGRVGRSNKTAYAYLTYKTGKILSEIATKRLSAIREFAEFGSGFKIAMRDLEIRGAGNVLGAEQSGHLMNVGYELYLKLLEEAVLEEKGEKVQKEAECTIDLAISANIPENFIEDLGQRIDLYRRIAMIKTDTDYLEMIDEIIDRFGEPSINIINLCKIAKIRAIAMRSNIINIVVSDGKLKAEFENPDMEKITKLCGCKEYNGKIMLSVAKKPYIIMNIDKKTEILKISEDLFTKLATL